MKFALLIALALTLPIAVADETQADCEDEQWWAGYHATRPVEETVEPLAAEHGVALVACEGEQWDGQDSVAPDEPADCPVCLGPDPNAGGDDLLQPVGARASASDEDGAREAYLALNVALVGRVAIYAGACEGGAGLEGDEACGGSLEGRAGLYHRDNTPANVLSHFLQPRCFLSITGCFIGENDCSYAYYHELQKQGNPHWCSRDNTALGAGLVLA